MNHTLHVAADGTSYVTIELTNAPGRYVKMDADDWASWLRRELSPALFLSDDGGRRAYVQYYSPLSRGLCAYAARQVIRARSGWVVKYANGDRTDLRRANLYTVKRACPGRAPTKDAATGERAARV